MVAAKRDEVLERRRLLLYEREAFRYVAQRNVEVADVSHRQRRGIGPPVRMVAVHQHAAGLPDGGRPEPGAAAVGGADIERNASNMEGGVIRATRNREKARR